MSGFYADGAVILADRFQWPVQSWSDTQCARMTDISASGSRASVMHCT